MNAPGRRAARGPADRRSLARACPACSRAKFSVARATAPGRAGGGLRDGGRGSRAAGIKCDVPARTNRARTVPSAVCLARRWSNTTSVVPFYTSHAQGMMHGSQRSPAEGRVMQAAWAGLPPCVETSTFVQGRRARTLRHGLVWHCAANGDGHPARRRETGSVSRQRERTEDAQNGGRGLNVRLGRTACAKLGPGTRAGRSAAARRPREQSRLYGGRARTEGWRECEASCGHRVDGI